MTTTALVIENDPRLGLGRASEWLTEAGMELDFVRPHAGDAVPKSAGGHDALIALGGAGEPERAEELTGLLKCAVADSTPALALGSSAQLLAAAFGGRIEPSSEPQGARMLAKRDEAGRDALFGSAPMTLDVICWRTEELVSLPEEATLLAASPYGALEVFRIRQTAWGVQSHFELAPEQLARLESFDEAHLERARRVDEHIVETWRPILQRFVRIAAGELRELPVIDG